MTGDPIVLMQETDGSSANDAATAWFVRLRDEAVSDRDRRAFEAWRNADPAHAEAYREMERLWSGLDQVRRFPDEKGAVKRSAARAADLASPGRRRALRRMAVAASVAVVAFAGAYSLTQPGVFADYRTSAGEQRQVVLADGSTAHLGTATALSADYDANRRLVTVHGGDVYFEIATDAARPFVVDAAIGRIEALGTAFSVTRVNGTVEVVVTESKVAVSDADGRTAVVAAGQGVRLSDAGLGPVMDVDAGRALAWRRNRLVFDNRPLGEVLRELERYRRGRIMILDDAVEDLPVTGSFSVTDTDATLETIERTLPIRLYRLGDRLLLVDALPAH